MLTKDTPRWKRLRVRAFASGVEITQLAKRLDYSRPYLSDVLNGKLHSETALNRVEKALSEIESDVNTISQAA